MTQSDFLKSECRHCAGHIEYPAGAGGETIACPHCGQPMELPPVPVAAEKRSRRPLVLVLFTPGIAVAAIGTVFALQKRPALVSAPEKSVVPAPAPVVKP